jgi:hypothetical protein
VRRGCAYQATAWAVTQVFFVLTLVPFRAPSFEAALSYGKGLFASAGSAMPMLVSVKNATNLTFCIAFLLVYHFVLTDPGRSTRERFLALPGPVRGFAYGVGVVLLSLLMPAGAGAFIYGQF